MLLISRAVAEIQYWTEAGFYTHDCYPELSGVETVKLMRTCRLLYAEIEPILRDRLFYKFYLQGDPRPYHDWDKPISNAFFRTQIKQVEVWLELQQNCELAETVSGQAIRALAGYLGMQDKLVILALHAGGEKIPSRVPVVDHPLVKSWCEAFRDFKMADGARLHYKQYQWMFLGHNWFGSDPMKVFDLKQIMAKLA